MPAYGVERTAHEDPTNSIGIPTWNTPRVRLLRRAKRRTADTSCSKKHHIQPRMDAAPFSVLFTHRMACDRRLRHARGGYSLPRDHLGLAGAIGRPRGTAVLPAIPLGSDGRGEALIPSPQRPRWQRAGSPDRRQFASALIVVTSSCTMTCDRSTDRLRHPMTTVFVPNPGVCRSGTGGGFRVVVGPRPRRRNFRVVRVEGSWHGYDHQERAD